MSWTSFIVGLPFHIAGAVSCFVYRHFKAGWNLAWALMS